MKYKIKTTTKQSTYGAASIFNAIVDELDIDEALVDDDVDTIESYLEGEIIENGDDVTVSYAEIIDNDGALADTTITFKKSNPKEIFLTRHGAVTSVMQFTQGGRTICVYNTPFMPFEICVFTKLIDNKLLECGYLEITYLIEIKGACAQKTIFRMDVQGL